MMDFIEYVISELKNKKISKSNALALIKQYSTHTKTTDKVSVIHPLLHVNTSNLNQQSYSSTFSGKESFLEDHQININSKQKIKILPGVAYLEMARVAVEKALPTLTDTVILELQDIVWMQPVVVADNKEVSIALWANENNEIDFEIYGQDEDAESGLHETIHCQGKAKFIGNPSPTKLSIEQIKGQMQRGKLNSSSVYAAYAKMGLNYGPTHQVISDIFQGEDQLLAKLRLSPDSEEQSQYLLHPGLMDGALQSTVGLIPDINRLPDKPSVPFALEKLRIFSAFKKDMFVWVRSTEGSKPDDKSTKLDIDLCDIDGNICVQIKGFSSRMLTSDVSSGSTVGSLLAAPVWESTTLSTANELEFSQHHILLYGLDEISTKQVESKITHSLCLSMQTDVRKNIAEQYSKTALSCFEHIQTILRGKPQGNVLLQIVIANNMEGRLFTGLTGLLRTASIENPRFTGQIILCDPKTATDELVARLQADKSNPQDTIINHDRNKRHVLHLQEIRSNPDKPAINFKNQGVYLVTGGLGGLGTLFTKEILQHASNARIILIGRSELTESKKAILNTLSEPGRVVEYKRADIANLDQVRQLIAYIKDEYKQLNGILHCAGMVSDNFILKKTPEEFTQVLLPKVTGTFNLDVASKDSDLDFFVLFSSGVSVTGNNGQSDYATANGFMDQFAVYRNELAGAGQRYGRTLSINWPLWQEGGMNVDQTFKEKMQEVSGIYPLTTATGMQAFHRSLSLQYDQTLVVEGDLTKIRHALLPVQTVQPKIKIAQLLPLQTEDSSVKEQKRADEINSGSFLTKTQDFLRKQFAAVLRLSPNKLDIQAPLENYGINSILAMNLTSQLEKIFGSLSKTLFFEYQTIAELSEHFVRTHPDKLSEFLDVAETKVSTVPIPVSVKTEPQSKRKNLVQRRLGRQLVASPTQVSRTVNEPIAIIGISGRFPQSANIDEFWNNLRDGKDCITEVPNERWDWHEFYSADPARPGRHNSKWGGFISGVDEFDPRFFNISPREAIYIDPQERLFLQHAWAAVEDAGYTKASLQIPHGEDQPAQVGVYVGVMYGEYNLSGSLASIANRVSYVFNLHGPSMTLDTMCSSSLTAIHLACEDLKHRRTDLAIAGGVNVSIRPNKYTMLSFGQFISSDGRCQSFGEGGNGYIPGEGVGAVILKRLSEAERDGNHIYGIIKGSAINHGGKTNGYTVPNPQAQASAISRALLESNTNPRHISYIEAHGTGTKLGDPIEIASLSKAFQQHTQETGFCLIGSAKSNIGHCESAAGVAGVVKVLLQMKYQKIVPSLHSAQLNPSIDFDRSPFVVNQELKKWEQPVIDGKQIPRLAGLSSFGAGGSNAHIILQEYVSEGSSCVSSDTTVIIPLSARTDEQLKQKASDLLKFIQTSRPDLVAAAYTLQVGREAMEERLGFIVSSIDQLTDKLKAYLKGEPDIEGLYQGQMKQDKGLLSAIIADADFNDTVNKWLTGKKLSKALELWVNGLDLNWNKLYPDVKPKWISLPTYPFAKERYWIDSAAGEVVAPGGTTTAVLHPFLHTNTSNFGQQSYSSTFSGKEFFLNDHQVNTSKGSVQKMFPALAFLEMARIAIEQASSIQDKRVAVELHNIAWGQPAMISEAGQVNIALYKNDADDFFGSRVDYDIYGGENGTETVYCQGHAIFINPPSPIKLDIEQVITQVRHSRSDTTNLYVKLNKMGFNYGPAFRCVKAIYKGNGALVAELSLPFPLHDFQREYILHPSIINGALQASMELFENMPDHPLLPIALESLRVDSACTKEMYALIRYSSGNLQSDDDLIKLDVDLCDLEGNVCVQMSGLCLRQIALVASLQTRNEIAVPSNTFLFPASVTDKPKAIRLNGFVPINSGSMPTGKPQIIELADTQKVNGEISGKQKIHSDSPRELEGARVDIANQNISSVDVSMLPLMVSKEMERAFSQAQLQEQLRTSLAKALYLEPSEIDVDKAFVDLGLDSIIGVEWVKAINKQLGLGISATKVYDYSNIRAFASFLSKENSQIFPRKTLP